MSEQDRVDAPEHDDEDVEAHKHHSPGPLSPGPLRSDDPDSTASDDDDDFELHRGGNPLGPGPLSPDPL